MRKLIDGKIYDTEKAEKIVSASWGDFNSFWWTQETLYRTAAGKWFFLGEGGPHSKYKIIMHGSVGAGRTLVALCDSDVLEWLLSEDLNVLDERLEVLKKYFPDSVPQEA